jgi:transposase-like protein
MGMAEPTTLLEAERFFADPDQALDFVVKMRWPDGVTCPRCDCREVGFISTRRVWRCKGCKKDFSAKVGTILEDSPIGFGKWLPAIWLICSSKNEISSYELARDLGVTQKTAWFMLHRIRMAMQAESWDKLTGEVEVDETYIGGKSRKMHKKADPRRHRRRGKGRGHGPPGAQQAVPILAGSREEGLQSQPGLVTG